MAKRTKKDSVKEVVQQVAKGLSDQTVCECGHAKGIHSVELSSSGVRTSIFCGDMKCECKKYKAAEVRP